MFWLQFTGKSWIEKYSGCNAVGPEHWSVSMHCLHLFLFKWNKPLFIMFQGKVNTGLYRCVSYFSQFSLQLQFSESAFDNKNCLTSNMH